MTFRASLKQHRVLTGGNWIKTSLTLVTNISRRLAQNRLVLVGLGSQCLLHCMQRYWRRKTVRMAWDCFCDALGHCYNSVVHFTDVHGAQISLLRFTAGSMSSHLKVWRVELGPEYYYLSMSISYHRLEHVSLVACYMVERKLSRD